MILCNFILQKNVVVKCSHIVFKQIMIFMSVKEDIFLKVAIFWDVAMCSL
jgi:hypothetical protein